ncbi:MAG: response regulator [Chitinophagales bacterium]|nr:response regulator [Chitinophagales bacterium]
MQNLRLDYALKPYYFVAMAMAQQRSILLLDTDEKSAQDIQRFLKVSAFAFGLSHAADTDDALSYLKNHQPNLILLDAGFAALPKYEEVRKIAEGYKIPVILLSETASPALKAQAEKAGADDFLLKNKVNLFSLQKIIVNTLKLNETTGRLDNAVEEYTARHETFSTILNRVSEGVMIINADNHIRFANERAYKILGEEGIRQHMRDFLLYREIDAEETISFKGKQSITIRISPIEWQHEHANLVILQKVAAGQPEAETSSLLNVISMLLDSIDMSVVLLRNNRVVFANKHAAAQLYFRQKELEGKKLNDIFGSEDEMLGSSSLQNFMSEKRSSGVVKVSDGSTRPVDYLIRYLNLDDELYRIVSFTLKDISPETEIPKAREEKDHFSTDDVLHLASHDLREPVRTILNYVQLIADHLSKEKYEQAIEYAGYAKDAAARMDKLLSDLKVYIALSDYAFTMSKISMKLLVNDVLKNLKQRIEETGAVVNVAALPDISGDRELVEKLLYHLVDNSLRFHRKTNPVVDIGFDKYEGNVVFCVRDNGIGIAKKYHQKVFELFERLNRVDEFPGNGLGLPICKKIVELHGGKIWVESLPGAGSSFYFTLRGK